MTMHTGERRVRWFWVVLAASELVSFTFALRPASAAVQYHLEFEMPKWGNGVIWMAVCALVAWWAWRKAWVRS